MLVVTAASGQLGRLVIEELLKTTPAGDGYEVTGQLSLHGVTVTIQFAGGKTAEFPAGVHRTGFTGELVIKRSAFGIDKFQEVVGDEVQVSLSFEGTRK